MEVRSFARSAFYPVAGILFLLLLYRLSTFIIQIRTLFALTLIAFPTLYGMFAGLKLLRVKEASTRSIVLFLVVLAITVPFFFSSQMLYLMGFPNPLESTYSSQPIIIVMFAVFGIVIVSASQVRDFLMRLVSPRTSRSVKDAIERVSSAVQKVQGAITGAYGKNVQINTLSALELASALNAILGDVPATYQIDLLNRNDEEEGYHYVNRRGRIARVAVVDDDQSYRSAGGGDARYLGALHLRGGLPALKASGGENQMSMLISSLLGSDATEMSLIVNMKPHRPSLAKKLKTREAPTSLRTIEIGGQTFSNRSETSWMRRRSSRNSMKLSTVNPLVTGRCRSTS